VIPPYLSLPTVIDILKLIKDDDYLIQAMNKNVLVECLETLEDMEEQGNEEVLVQHV
jgi:hypothetical protein